MNSEKYLIGVMIVIGTMVNGILLMAIILYIYEDIKHIRSNRELIKSNGKLAELIKEYTEIQNRITDIYIASSECSRPDDIIDRITRQNDMQEM